MDELLGLLEGSDPPPTPSGAGAGRNRWEQSHDPTQRGQQQQQQHVSSSSIQRGRPRSNNNNSNADNSNASASTATHSSSSTRQTKATDQQRKQQLTTVDPLTKLRIINRRTSRIDLADTLSPFEFVSTAKLASMTIRDLSALVTVPSRGSNDNAGFSYGAGPAPNANAFAGGKTNAATMGVLFSNSGTKISANNGRAYSIFQIGDMSTGPIVSVFLFGDAYSKHTGNGSYSGREGNVIGILCPNILPPKRGGDTAVSLSINSPDRIVHVGTAQDYGTCAGMVRVRRDGKFVDTRCKKYVDKRLGLYCASHKNQGLQKQQTNGSAGKQMRSSAMAVAGKNATFIQKLRADRAARATNNVMPSQRPAAGSMNVAGGNCFGTSQPMGRGGVQASSSLASALVAAGMQQESTNILSQGHAVANSMVQGGGGKSNLNIPMHLKKTTAAVPGQIRGNIPRAASGAAAGSKYKRPPMIRGGKDVFGDTLNRAKQRTSLVPPPKKKERKVAHASGFDGRVQVPKPSRSLFGSAPSSARPDLSRLSSVAVTPSPNADALREKQRQLAEALRKRKRSGGGESISHSLSVANNPYGKQTSVASGATNSSTSRLAGSTQGKMDDIFAGLEDLDRADAIVAKSKYSDEADAEQYARSRQIVNDLEKKESRKDAQEERRKKQKGDDTVIQTEWSCLTCGRTGLAKPIACITRGHKVKRKREIKHQSTREESRDKMNKTRAEDGGLKLGSGLEWSMGYKN